jgi:hypothetical protein
LLFNFPDISVKAILEESFEGCDGGIFVGFCVIEGGGLMLTSDFPKF